MTINEDIRKFLKTRPFVPFTVHMSDGDSHRVHHPDYAFLSPLGQMLEVYEEDDTQAHWLHVAQISKISPDAIARSEEKVTTGKRE